MTPLNYRYTPPEIDHALTVSGARAILAHAEREADIAVSKASDLPLGVISYGDESREASLEALLKAKPPANEMEQRGGQHRQQGGPGGAIRPVSEGYGMTEIGLAALNPPIGVDKPGSIGLPSPGFVFSIRDAEGRKLPAGEEGRFWVRTPTQSPGYWNDPKASSKVVNDGWFDTGDVMKIDDGSYVWFCGRQKQIIVHDGSNISPQEVEDSLLAHPGSGERRRGRRARPDAWRGRTCAGDHAYHV